MRAIKPCAHFSRRFEAVAVRFFFVVEAGADRDFLDGLADAKSEDGLFAAVWLAAPRPQTEGIVAR